MPKRAPIDAVLDDKTDIKRQLVEVEAYVREGARLIDEKIRLIKAMHARGCATTDADHTLEVMIMVQAGHVAHRNQLKRELTRILKTP